jgi:hypothetical protein
LPRTLTSQHSGRKAQGDFSQLASTLSVRMPDDMRAQLEAAAKQRHRSLTQEMLSRLRRSFDRERDEKRDRASRGLCYLLAETIYMIEANAHAGAEPEGWRSDPFVFRTVRLTFDKVLGRLQPPGEIRRPDLADTAIGGGSFVVGGDTPEQMSEIAADVMMMMLQGVLREFAKVAASPEGRAANMVIPSGQRDREYGMGQAAEDLGLLPRKPKS